MTVSLFPISLYRWQIQCFMEADNTRLTAILIENLKTRDMIEICKYLIRHMNITHILVKKHY